MSCAKLEAVSPQQKQYSNDYVLFIDTAMGHQWLSHLQSEAVSSFLAAL